MDSKDYNRIWAFIIDTIVFSILASLISSLLFVHKEQTPIMGFYVSGWMLCYNLCILFYFFIFDILRNGVTIGKSIVSIQVYKTDNTLPTIGQHLLRSLLKWVSTWIFPLSVIVYIFSQRTLHDAACNTKTV